MVRSLTLGANGYALTLVLLAASATDAAEAIPLWPDGAPGFEDRRDEAELAESYWVKNIHNPSITPRLPDADKATGAAVIVCPGGGHRELVFNAEGLQAAEYLRDRGVAAFALKYRLGREEGSPYQVAEHPREDIHRAIRQVRSRAEEWGVDPQRVGVLGFSAGGEVASMAAFTPNAGDPDAADPIDRLSARPDFLMYVYPGPVGIPETIPEDAPPAFLLVANDDRGAAWSVMRLLNGYRKSRASVEAHVFGRGGHAFNMGDRSELRTISGWPERMTDWLHDNGWLTPRE